MLTMLSPLLLLGVFVYIPFLSLPGSYAGKDLKSYISAANAKRRRRQFPPSSKWRRYSNVIARSILEPLSAVPAAPALPLAAADAKKGFGIGAAAAGREE